MIYIVLIIIAALGAYFYQSLAGVVDSLANKISQPWIKFIVKALLKAVLIFCITLGAVSAALVAIALNYNPSKKRHLQ